MKGARLSRTAAPRTNTDRVISLSPTVMHSAVRCRHRPSRHPSTLFSASLSENNHHIPAILSPTGKNTAGIKRRKSSIGSLYSVHDCELAIYHAVTTSGFNVGVRRYSIARAIEVNTYSFVDFIHQKLLFTTHRTKWQKHDV